MNVSNDEQQQHNKQTTQNNKNEIGEKSSSPLMTVNEN